MKKAHGPRAVHRAGGCISLVELAGALERMGSRLIVRSGPSLSALRDLITEMGANGVYWNRRREPETVGRDGRIESALHADGVRIETFNGAQLFEPEAVKNQHGFPFQVFTAYWRACLRLQEPAAPIPAPRRIPAPTRWPTSLPIGSLGLEPRVDWAAGLRATWHPSERGATQRLRDFLKQTLDDYATDRECPGQVGTSRLSPHLHFGEIGPRQIWHGVRTRQEEDSMPDASSSADVYLRELGWREFAHHLLYHFPHMANEPLRTPFSDFPRDNNRAALRAWQRGQTGYPIVDAGMRELLTMGWMHNRVRMIVGSFLVKHLLVDWREGAAWFWDTLVDADLANNSLGWQWVAGCGADAAPYFRIFNPMLQGRKFDPSGEYVRRWVPELAGLEHRWLHAPWEAPAAALGKARVDLGRNYPRPIIDHAVARRRALDALATIRGHAHAE